MLIRIVTPKVMPSISFCCFTAPVENVTDVFVYICLTTPMWVGYATKSIFKCSKAGWNSEFSFWIGCLT